jgi:hypothetical protein
MTSDELPTQVIRLTGKLRAQIKEALLRDDLNIEQLHRLQDIERTTEELANVAQAVFDADHPLSDDAA